MKRLAFVLIFALHFFALSLSAQTPTGIADLLKLQERPTMLTTEPLLATVEFPPQVPVTPEWANTNGYDKRIDIKTWTQTLLEYTPKLIAQFEKTYPGGTWVFMGRDGAAFGDVFEAFYAAHGEKNRVMRMGVSRKSFDSITIELARSMFNEMGYNLSEWKDRPPLLFVDPVSKGNGRQGRTLIGLLYEYLMTHQNAQLEDLIKKINMIGLIVSTHPGQYFSAQDPEAYYAHYQKIIETAKPKDFRHIFHYHQFLSIDEAPNFANESGYTHFIGAWHDSFGQFYWDENKKAKTQTGEAFHDDLKLSILWTQKQIWAAVRTPEFLKRVQEEARKLGYEYPIQSPTQNSCEKLLKNKNKDKNK